MHTYAKTCFGYVSNHFLSASSPSLLTLVQALHMLLVQFSAVGLVEWKVLIVHFLSFCIICIFSEPGTINSSWLSNFQGPSQSGMGRLCSPGLCLACAKGWYFIMNLGAHGRDQSVAACCSLRPICIWCWAENGPVQNHLPTIVANRLPSMQHCCRRTRYYIIHDYMHENKLGTPLRRDCACQHPVS